MRSIFFNYPSYFRIPFEKNLFDLEMVHGVDFLNINVFITIYYF